MRRQSKVNTRGFSLIELLIVVTIILILAAIAIPRLLAVKQLANASAAVVYLHTLNTAEGAYASEFPAVGYSPTLVDLGGPDDPTAAATSTSAYLVDMSLATSNTVPKQGYTYVYSPGANSPCNSYSITASPQPAVSYRYFFTDQTGDIRYSDNTAATSASSLIG